MGPLPSLAYDAHGNTTQLADQTLAYDGADRHTKTTLTDGTVISYKRDATGRIIERTSTTPGETAKTIRYTFAAGGLFGVLNASGALIEQKVSMPGSVSVSAPVNRVTGDVGIEATTSVANTLALLKGPESRMGGAMNADR